MFARSDARRFGQSGSAKDHTSVILASPETERGPRGPRAIIADPSGISRRRRLEGNGRSAMVHHRGPAPASSDLRVPCFVSGRASPDSPSTGTAHASSAARRHRKAAPCPAKGNAGGTKEEPWKRNQPTFSTSCSRPRRRGASRRCGAVCASTAKMFRRVAPLRRQGRGRRMGAVQHRTVRVGEPHRRHHHARRPRARQARPDAHHQGLVV